MEKNTFSSYLYVYEIEYEFFHYISVMSLFVTWHRVLSGLFCYLNSNSLLWVLKCIYLTWLEVWNPCNMVVRVPGTECTLNSLNNFVHPMHTLKYQTLFFVCRLLRVPIFTFFFLFHRYKLTKISNNMLHSCIAQSQSCLWQVSA